MLLRIALATLGFVYDDNEQMEGIENAVRNDKPYLIDNEEICCTKYEEHSVRYENPFEDDA